MKDKEDIDQLCFEKANEEYLRKKNLKKELKSSKKYKELKKVKFINFLKKSLVLTFFSGIIFLVNILFQSKLNIQTTQKISYYFVAYALAIFSFVRYYFKFEKSLTKIAQFSILTIIFSGVANFCFRFILNINPLFTFGDVLIVISYILFIASFTNFTYKEIYSRKDENCGKRGKSD